MYAKTVWLDHVTDKPGLYVINDNHDGTWTITPAGKVMQQGTPQDQAHFNNIETGIWDIYAAFGMMFNTVRQQGWQLNETVATIDNSWQIVSGSVDLTNARTYPCNNSKKIVSLGKNMGSTSYLVMTELVKSDGPVGDIEVSEKLVNGFKLAYNGSAKSATIKYIAIGGTLK